MRHHCLRRVKKTVGMGLISLLLICPAAVVADSVRFAVVSDTQGDPVNRSTFPNVVHQILTMSPEVQFVIVAGDLVWGTPNYGPMTEQYAEWMKVAEPWFDSEMSGAKVYPIPGNHDSADPTIVGQLWSTYFPNLPQNGPEGDKGVTYSFDAGPCHLVLVNTYSPGREHRVSDMEWFKADLAASDKPVKLVFGHDPAYPFYRHLESSMDAYPEERDAFWQTLVDQKVRAYLCGHEHEYDHWIKDGVHQLISGGLPGDFNFSHNYFVVDADETDVTVGVYWYNGILLSSFKLSDTDDVSQTDHLGEAELKEAMPFSCPGIFWFTGLTLSWGFLALQRTRE